MITEVLNFWQCIGRQGHKKSQCAIKTVKAKTKVAHTNAIWESLKARMCVCVRRVLYKLSLSTQTNEAHILVGHTYIYMYIEYITK